MPHIIQDVSLGNLITLVMIFLGGLWGVTKHLSTLDYVKENIKANTDVMKEVKVSFKTLTDILHNLDNRMIRVETRLDFIGVRGGKVNETGQ